MTPTEIKLAADLYVDYFLRKQNFYEGEQFRITGNTIRWYFNGFAERIANANTLLDFVTALKKPKDNGKS